MTMMNYTNKYSIYLSFVASGPVKLFGHDINCDEFRLCVSEGIQYSGLTAIHANFPDLYRNTDATIIQPIKEPRVMKTHCYLQCWYKYMPSSPKVCTDKENI